MFLHPSFFMFFFFFLLYFTRAFINFSKIFFRKSAFASLPLTSFCNRLVFREESCRMLFKLGSFFFAAKAQNTPVSCHPSRQLSCSVYIVCGCWGGRIFIQPKYSINLLVEFSALKHSLISVVSFFASVLCDQKD